MCGFFQETLHKHSGNSILSDDSDEALEAGSCEPNEKGKTVETEESGPIPKKSLLRNWPLMSSIIVYCIFSLHDMAYTEVSLIPLFLNYIYLYFVGYWLSIITFQWLYLRIFIH